MGSMGIERARMLVTGAVQGVGFRPFVYRLAKDLGLAGWVENTAAGVRIEVEGSPAIVESFGQRLRSDAPSRALVESVEAAHVEPCGEEGFAIRPSDSAGIPAAPILPDIAMCEACHREMLDPRDRRFRYPFINCTDCGPRYSIVLGVPYDRARTTMKAFEMCDACRAEYEDPASRRFHAEPIACPVCGPHVELWDTQGRFQLGGEDAIAAAAAALDAGRVVAVKGVGGFHLMVDARNEDAVRALRHRKRREEKPFAVMAPDLDYAQRLIRLDRTETRLLVSAAAPIVIASRGDDELAPSVAPGSGWLGVFLPYTPLHWLLAGYFAHAVVATSGNVSDEPICFDEREAVVRLDGIADAFLVHDRPIARYVDDSVARVLGGRTTLLRRARGYAPLAVAHLGDADDVLAVGGHMKNAVALAVGGRVVLGPHVGDLETVAAVEGFQRTIDTLSSLYRRSPQRLVTDAHPDYASTQWAARQRLSRKAVQHHYAHVLSGMADNRIEPPVLGIAWDGTGYGLDGTIWGGEALKINDRGFDRVAWLRAFPLPGGDAAARDPRRAALGLFWDMAERGLLDWEEQARRFGSVDLRRVRWMLEQSVNGPRTSSAGRLFDAAAAILGVHARRQFEGQAAMALESAIGSTVTDERYPFLTCPSETGLALDWAPMITALLRDRDRGVGAPVIAARFHNTLAEIIVAAAWRGQESRVLLSGGCFQNKYLSERAITRLREEGFVPYWHHEIPPNDGGLAVGQLAALARDGMEALSCASQSRVGC